MLEFKDWRDARFSNERLRVVPMPLTRTEESIAFTLIPAQSEILLRTVFTLHCKTRRQCARNLRSY